jgi:hypothetical protein
MTRTQQPTRLPVPGFGTTASQDPSVNVAIRGSGRDTLTRQSRCAPVWVQWPHSFPGREVPVGEQQHPRLQGGAYLFGEFLL